MPSGSVRANVASTSRVPTVTSWPSSASRPAMACPTLPVPRTEILIVAALPSDDPPSAIEVRVARDHTHVRPNSRPRHCRGRGDGHRDQGRDPSTLLVSTVLVTLEFVAVVWATDQRSAVVL